MGYHRILSVRRTLCFSYKYTIKHYLFKLAVPSSFITICVLLFLKIQHFGDDRSSGSIPKTPEAKIWDDVIKSGVTISNPELFKRAMLMMRGDYLNSSARLMNYNNFAGSNSINSDKKLLGHFIRGEMPTRQNNNISSMTENLLPEYLRKQSPNSTRHQRRSENVNSNSIITVKQKPQPVFVVILVISRPNNVLLRLAARKTWARDAELYKILVRFVVGRQEDWSDIVDRESSMHKDVIVFEEDDVEEVLPSKVIRGFEWALNVRPTPIYVMKIDDDTIVNLPYLAKELFKPTTVSDTQIVGSIREKVTVTRDLQNDKWAVSMLDYPSSTYPTYVFGGAYVMRAPTAKTLLEQRYYTYSWVHLEDVYLTGFVAARAGMRHKHHRGFSTWDEGKATACDFVLDRRINSINNTEQDFYELYKGIQFLLRSKNKEYCN